MLQLRIGLSYTSTQKEKSIRTLEKRMKIEELEQEEIDLAISEMTLNQMHLIISECFLSSKKRRRHFFNCLKDALNREIESVCNI